MNSGVSSSGIGSSRTAAYDGSCAEELLRHRLHDEPLLRRRVEGRREAPVAEEGDGRDGVVERREGRDGEDVAGDLEGALADRLLPAGGLALAAAERAVEGPRGHGDEEVAEPPVGLGLPLAGVAVDLERLARERRDGERPRLHLDVALRGLLGVVEGVGVEERPDELTADVLERELEVGVLERRVVPGEVDVPGEGVAAGAAALLLDRVGDASPPTSSGGDDPLRAVAGARGGDDAVEGAREGVHEPATRGGGREHADGV